MEGGWPTLSPWICSCLNVPEDARDGRGSRVGDDGGTVIPGALCTSPLCQMLALVLRVLRQLVICSFVYICIVLLGVLTLPPMLLDLGHAVVTGGGSDVMVTTSNLLFFRGDSPVAKSVV